MVYIVEGNEQFICLKQDLIQFTISVLMNNKK